MTLEQGRQLIDAFGAAAGTDPYLVVHFCRESDEYQAGYDGMDKLDAMIVIRSLVKEFGIDDMLLETAKLKITQQHSL